MGDKRTVLLPVQEGDIWRVQIIWSNGLMHHFGKFISDQEAGEWIKRHEWWLTEPAKADLPSEPSEPSTAA